MSRRRGGSERRNSWEPGEQQMLQWSESFILLVFMAISVNIGPVLCQGSCFLQQHVNAAER